VSAIDHLDLVVTSLDAWPRAQHAQIESEPREYDDEAGYHAVFLHDPDAIKLEIVHRPHA
jgi:hypothetical protein